MKTNDYRSGKIANMIGSTQEALRYYQSNQIYTPRKKGKFKYDIYSDHDLACLYNIRAYKTFGFPIKKSAELVKSQNFQSVNRNIQEIEEYVIRSRKWSELLYEHAELLLSYTKEIELLNEDYKIVQLPEMVIFSSDTSKLSAEDAQIIKELATMTPVVFPLYKIKTDYFKNTYTEAQCSLAILKKDLDYFVEYHDIHRLIEKGIIRTVEPVRCLTGIVEIQIELSYNPDLFTGITDYIRKKHYKITSDVYGVLAATNYRTKFRDKEHDYYKVWIPIK